MRAAIGRNDGGKIVALRLRRFSDASEFAANAIPFLVQQEAENCLLLGIIGVLARGGSQYTGANYLASVEDEGQVRAVAVMTPPHGPVVSRMDDSDAIDLVVSDLSMHADRIPSVLGPATTAGSFAEHWASRTGDEGELALHERVHELTRIVPPKLAPGRFRLATEADLGLLAALIRRFNREAFGAASPQVELENTMVTARLRGEMSGFALWEDGDAVSVAGFGNSTPNGVMVGPVYTPPEFRGRGYATSLTAALSQQLFDRGKSRIFLFTDLSNPISNHVYEKIGFEPVTDVDQWRFTPPAEP